MDPGTKQSLTTGIATILGALLVPLVAKYGFSLTADQLNQLAGLLATGGATLFAVLGHLIGGLVHAPTGTVKATDATVAAANKEGGFARLSALGSLAIGGLIVLCALPGLSGCASLGSVSSLLQAGVDGAVALYVGTNTSTQAARAATLSKIANEVLADVGSTTTTVAALESAINAEAVKIGLTGDELLAVNAVASALAGYLQTLIANSATASAITNTTEILLADVCNDILQATAAYSATAGRRWGKEKV